MNATTSLATEIVFAPHAIERYQERVRPGLSVDHAAAELAQVANHGVLRLTAPDWLVERQRQEAPLYLEVGDTTFPVKPTQDGARMVALTCIAKGGLSPQARQRRNLARRVRHKRDR